MALAHGPDLPTPVRPDPLAHLVGALAEAAARVERVTDADAAPVLRLLRSAMAALPPAEPRLTAQPPSAGLRAWRHELRGHVSAMAGWAVIFSQTPSPGSRARAFAAIERNAKAAARLLALPSA